MEFFLARRDGQVVGRIAAFSTSAHNRFHEENAGFFGFFECVNDAAVAEALLSRARAMGWERGATFLRGPVNPSTNYECGMLVDGFDSDPMVMMTYNPPYYPALMERVGSAQGQGSARRICSNANTIEMKKIDRVADKALEDHGRARSSHQHEGFRRGSGARLERLQAHGLGAATGDSFPCRSEEFAAMGKEMKQILKPELVLIGEVEGRVVGFALALARRQPGAEAGGREICFPQGSSKSCIINV